MGHFPSPAQRLAPGTDSKGEVEGRMCTRLWARNSFSGLPNSSQTQASPQDSQLLVVRSNCFSLISQCKLHIFDKVKNYPERRQKPMRNLKQFRKLRCIHSLF